LARFRSVFLREVPQPSAARLRSTREKSSGYAWVAESGFLHRLLKQRCRQRFEARTEDRQLPFFQRRPNSTIG